MKVAVHDAQPFEEWRPGVQSRMQVAASNGSSELCIFEQWVAPAAGAPSHTHTVEEVLTIVAGEADVWVEDEHAVLKGGQSVIIPAGRSHGFRNIGFGGLHIQAVLASPFFEATMDTSSQQVRRWFAPPGIAD